MSFRIHLSFVVLLLPVHHGRRAVRGQRSDQRASDWMNLSCDCRRTDRVVELLIILDGYEFVWKVDYFEVWIKSSVSASFYFDWTEKRLKWGQKRVSDSLSPSAAWLQRVGCSASSSAAATEPVKSLNSSDLLILWCKDLNFQISVSLTINNQNQCWLWIKHRSITATDHQHVQRRWTDVLQSHNQFQTLKITERIQTMNLGNRTCVRRVLHQQLFIGFMDL